MINTFLVFLSTWSMQGFQKPSLFFSLPVDVTMAVFIVASRTPEGWDFLSEKYRTSLQMSVKSRLKSAMASSPLQDKLKWCVHCVK